jgi:hypothetical protein
MNSGWMLRWIMNHGCWQVFDILYGERLHTSSLWAVLAWNVFAGSNRLLGVEDALRGVGAGDLVTFEYLSCIASSTTFFVTWTDNWSIGWLSNSGQSFGVLVDSGGPWLAALSSFTTLCTLKEWLLIYCGFQLSSSSEHAFLFVTCLVGSLAGNILRVGLDFDWTSNT